MNIFSLEKELYSLYSESKKLEEEHLAAVDILKNKQTKIIKKLNLLNADLNLDKIESAQSIVLLRGTYTGEGDQDSCLLDFKSWLIDERSVKRYMTPVTGMYSTKNYDAWRSQREDCSYDFGPRHGSINFGIGLLPEYRTKVLTEEQKDDILYYINNLKRIQECQKISKP